MAAIKPNAMPIGAPIKTPEPPQIKLGIHALPISSRTVSPGL